MTATLNASTSSGVILTSDTSGSLAIQSNGTTVLTASSSGVSLPSGTVAINGPAFSAYASANQSVANNTATKIQLNSELFDTASCFDTTTYRFTPNVAGYYQISVYVLYSVGVSSGTAQAKIYKNGVDTYDFYVVFTSTTLLAPSGSALVYLNGTTDYIELYTAQSTGASANTLASASNIWMTGALVRGA